MISVIAYTVGVLILASFLVGRAIDNKVEFSFSDIFVGFSLFMGVFFIVTHYSVNNQFDSLKYHEWINWTFWSISIISVIRFILFKFNWTFLLLVALYLYFSIKLSISAIFSLYSFSKSAFFCSKSI